MLRPARPPFGSLPQGGSLLLLSETAEIDFLTVWRPEICDQGGVGSFGALLGSQMPIFSVLTWSVLCLGGFCTAPSSNGSPSLRVYQVTRGQPLRFEGFQK